MITHPSDDRKGIAELAAITLVVGVATLGVGVACASEAHPVILGGTHIILAASLFIEGWWLCRMYIRFKKLTTPRDGKDG